MALFALGKSTLAAGLTLDPPPVVTGAIAGVVSTLVATAVSYGQAMSR